MASPFIESIRRDIRLRLRGYSIQTEKAYLYWIRFYINYSGKRHPAEMGAAQVKEFLSFLANQRHVAMRWAQRLKRVFNIDIATCRHCGGQLKVIACIEDPVVIKAILPQYPPMP